MSKKYRKSLESLTDDQITEKVGAYFEKLLRNLTDRSIGTLRTAFNALVIPQQEHAMDLLAVAAQKNGVAFTGHDQTIVAVAEAAEHRGSAAAAKVRDYITFVRTIIAATAAEGISKSSNSPFAVAERVRTAKRLGPSPA